MRQGESGRVRREMKQGGGARPQKGEEKEDARGKTRSLKGEERNEARGKVKPWGNEEKDAR